MDMGPAWDKVGKVRCWLTGSDACKEACREMSVPTVQLWKKIKRIGRYTWTERRCSGSSF